MSETYKQRPMTSRQIIATIDQAGGIDSYLKSKYGKKIFWKSRLPPFLQGYISVCFECSRYVAAIVANHYFDKDNNQPIIDHRYKQNKTAL